MSNIMENNINDLKQNIYNIYESTRAKLRENIYKSYSRSMSSDVEDQIALYISKFFPNDYKFLLSPSININKREHKPDLLIIDNNNNVLAMIEIKANMGHCRNAEGVINKIVEFNNEFRCSCQLNCNISTENKCIEIKYSDNVKLFLIAFSEGNCSKDNHKNNKEYAKSQNVFYYTLFAGWYGYLVNKEIVDFTKCISEIID